MSQHNFSEPNEAGASYRAGINNALQALASQSSGASAPGTVYPYQRWCDTTNGLVKRRNAANSAWVTDGPLAETYIVTRSSNTILGVGDHGKFIAGNATFTQTLTAAATLGDGWYCDYYNSNSGAAMVLDPNASETINGATTYSIGPNQGVTIYCDGTGFYAIAQSFTIAGGWNPDLRFGGGNTGITYSSRSGIAVAVGGLVFYSFSIILTSKGSSTGAATIQGAPLNSVIVSGNAARGFGGICSNWANMLTSVAPSLQWLSTNQLGLFNQASGTGINALQNTDFNNTTELEGSFWAQLF